MVYRPTKASLANADIQRSEAQSSSTPEGRHIADMRWWEQQLLLHFQGETTRYGLDEVGRELQTIANNLEQRDSHRAQACARAMAAYCFLVTGNQAEASEQIVLAFALIGEKYENDVLRELAEQANPELVERTTQSSSSNTGSSSSRQQVPQDAGKRVEQDDRTRTAVQS
jgi:hypothetical protein